MGAALTKVYEGESKLKRLRLYLNSEVLQNNKHFNQGSPFAYSVWENLPYVALVEIYRYLPGNDKFNLSLTCKAWNQPFYRPEVWLKAKFYFNGRDDWRALSFSGSLSSGLRHLSIDCQEIEETLFGDTNRESTSYLYTFLDGLVNYKNCRLLTLRLTNMDRLTEWFEWSSRHDVVRVLGDLLSTQTSLELFDLSNAGFNAEKGLDILSIMAITCGSTVTTLTINDIMKSLVPVNITTQMRAFTKLTELSISYEYLSDDLLYALAASGSLKHLNVFAKADLDVLLPFSQSWERLTRSCPTMEAHYYIHEKLGFFDDLMSIMTPGIPLVDLEFSWADSFTCWTNICEHIADHFQNYLKRLHIVMCNKLFLTSHFLVIVDKCLMLEEISITDAQLYSSPAQAHIERSVRRALTHRPARRLRRFTLNGVEVNLNLTLVRFLADWVLDCIY